MGLPGTGMNLQFREVPFTVMVFAKLASVPGLCNLTKKALDDFLAGKRKESHFLELSDEQLSDTKKLVDDGIQAEKRVCQYLDQLMSTVKPCHPDEDCWIKPDIHPCKNLS